MRAECADCKLPYDDDGFVDLIVARDIWLKITPTGHEGGLLCPTCMCRAAKRAGLENIKAVFRSGPFCVGEDYPGTQNKGEINV